MVNGEAIHAFIDTTATNVAKFIEPFIVDIESRYSWEFKNETAQVILDFDFSIFPNAYQRTIHLKSMLSEKILESNDFGSSFIYGEYFVKDWGGVKTNKTLQDKLEPFFQWRGCPIDTSKLPRTLDGVSSWSKYLSLICDDAAIYDSRVAYAINTINYLSKNCSLFFPMPAGRSPRLNIVDIETLFVLGHISNEESFITNEDLAHRQVSSRLKKKYYLPEAQTYALYLQLLQKITKILNLKSEEHFKIEILLFALAPNEIFKNLITTLKN
jgi:hypothetical protein